MDDRIGLIVKAKVNIYPDTDIGDPIKSGTKGMVYSVLPENFTIEDESWFIIFQSGEALDFCEFERENYLDILTERISGSDRNRIHNKKMSEVIQDVVKKRIKL